MSPFHKRLFTLYPQTYNVHWVDTFIKFHGY